MANAKVDVKVDLSKFNKKLSPAQFQKGKKIMSNQALMDMNKLVPMDRKTLRASGHVTSRGDIEYSTIYARAQFYGTNGKRVFRKYSTPGTGKRWDLKATVLYADKWGRVLVRGMKL